MSDFVLHYDILEGIAMSSNSLGRQADEYANRLTDRIANAITSVTGSSSGYLEDASYYVKQKVSRLQRKAQDFYDFAEQITILAETATRVDDEVQKLLAENQEEFLSHHESLRIDDWKADILNWLVDIKNKLPFLEVLGNILSAVDTIPESFADSIKYWYQCEGGKYILEFVGGIALAALAVTLFVLTFPASGFLAICGVIGAGIAAINAITNVATSFRAAYAACNGDPTWARIYSKQDTLSQVIRETNFNNGTLNRLSYLGADLIDATEAFCCIAGLAQIGLSIKKLFSKKTLNIFKKGSFKLSHFKTSIKNSFADTKISIEKGFKDFKVNVKNIFGKTNKLDDMADLNKLDDIPVNSMDDILLDGGIDAIDDVITDGSHLQNGKLKPNTVYKTGEHDYIYKTNDDGLIINASADNLQLKTHTGRLNHESATYGKEVGDHAGHLFGDRFGGSPELDNLVSQAQKVNQSEFKVIENQWAKALDNRQKVTVDINLNYDIGGVRPVSFDVSYTIDDVPFFQSITN